VVSAMLLICGQVFFRVRLFFIGSYFLFFSDASIRQGDTLFSKLSAIATSSPYLKYGSYSVPCVRAGCASVANAARHLARLHFGCCMAA
jgi:hypothetical protein